MSVYFSRGLLFMLSVALFCNSYSQSATKYPNTLLWKISGNGLKEPSVLFGTMHLKDKRLFHLSDSLYYYLDKTNGFYMEVDPVKAFDGLIKAVLKEEENELNYEEDSDAPDIITISPKSKIEEKQKNILGTGSNSYPAKEDDMSNFLDLYLYNIAYNKGKATGGLEPVEEHLKLLEEFPETEIPSEKALDNMIQIYLKQDLNKILSISSEYNSRWKEKVLINRNYIISNSIDSLSNLSSSFFAVGAAHLPGEEGILNLLKKKGFLIEPIFSTNNISPDNYHYAKKDRQWEKHAHKQGAWKADFPVPPIEQVVDENMKINWNIDILTGMSYFIFDYHLPNAEITEKDQEEFKNLILENFMGDEKTLTEKHFIRNGLPVSEYTLVSDGQPIRVQYIANKSVLHLLMINSSKSDLYSEDADKFFNSFEVNKKYTQANNWVTYHNKYKAFSVDLPKMPEFNRQFTEKFSTDEKMKNWTPEVYTYEDNLSGMYYMLIIKTSKPGYNILNDSLLFDEVIEAFDSDKIENVGIAKKDGLLTLNMHIKGDDGFDMFNYQVNRGNTNYILMVVTETGKSDTAKINKFFNSFTLNNYQQADYTRQHVQDATVSTIVPGKFGVVDNEDDLPSWVAKDWYSGINYQIDRVTMNKYYEAESDEELFETIQNMYIDTVNNTILKKSYTQNGKLSGFELLVNDRLTSNNKRMRFIPNKDTVYVAYLIGIPDAISGPEQDMFFDSIKIFDQYPGKYHLEKKAGVLFNDLYYGTEFTFKLASEAIENFNFTKADLKYLHESILEPFHDFNLWDYCTHDYLLKKVVELNDSSSIKFIKENYAVLKEEKEVLKYPLLSALLQFETDYSYQTFKKLLEEPLPLAGNPLMIANVINDSMADKHGLIPILLNKSADSIFIRAVNQMLPEWKNSGLISKEMLMEYKPALLSLAQTIYDNISRESSKQIYQIAVNLLSIGDEDCLQMVRKLEKSSELFAVYQIVRALAENGISPDKKAVQSLAASKVFRISSFENLKEAGMLKLFPSKYAGRVSLAESEIYGYADKNYTPENIVYLKTVKEIFKGKLQEFILFKVSFKIDEGMEDYVGIVGPFNPKDKTDKGLSAIKNLYTDELFNEKLYLQQFKRHLQNEEANSNSN